MGNRVIANAFVSCSLSSVDQEYVEFVCRILMHFQIQPYGTVGKFTSAPINPMEHIKQNIDDADFVVVVATKRYMSILNNRSVNTISEMIHVESGIAYAQNKPILVFAQPGVDIGGFLPNITQPLVLTQDQQDLDDKVVLISDLIQKSISIARDIKDSKELKSIGKGLKTGLAIVGGLTILGWLFGGSHDGEQEE